MKRAMGWVAVGLGVFLLVVAVMANYWVPGQVQKTPSYVNTTTYLKGAAQKLNLNTGKLDNLPVRITVYDKTDSKRSDSQTVVWVQDVCVVANTGSPPPCVRSSDPRLIQASTTIFATDRVSGVAVNSPKYFKGVGNVTPEQGLVNKFPFNTEKRTYALWDDTLGGTAKAFYVGTQDLNGLQTYRFHQVVKKAPIELGLGIKGTYWLDKVIWVEPITGAIVDQKQHDVRTLADGSPALNMLVRFSPGSRSSGISDAKSNVSQFKLLTDTVPLVGLVLGILLLILGFALLLTGRRPRPEAEPSEQPEPTPVAH